MPQNVPVRQSSISESSLPPHIRNLARKIGGTGGVSATTSADAGEQRLIYADVIARTNQTLSGTSGSIDGVAKSAGQTVLLTAQATPEDNGLWAVDSGTWQRTGDGIYPYSLIKIIGGDDYGQTWWELQNASYVIGVDVPVFVQLLPAEPQKIIYCNAAERGNVSLVGIPSNVDGVTTLGEGDVILLTAQTDPQENGAWAVSSSGWARPTGKINDIDTLYSVRYGNAFRGTLWKITDDLSGDLIVRKISNSAFVLGEYYTVGNDAAQTAIAAASYEYRQIRHIAGVVFNEVFSGMFTTGSTTPFTFEAPYDGLYRIRTRATISQTSNFRSSVFELRRETSEGNSTVANSTSGQIVTISALDFFEHFIDVTISLVAEDILSIGFTSYNPSAGSSLTPTYDRAAFRAELLQAGINTEIF